MLDNRALCFVSSLERLNEFLVVYNSVRTFHPNLDIFLLFCNEDNVIPPVPADVKIVQYEKDIDCVGRVFIIKHLLELEYGKVVCLDNDMYVYAPLDELYSLLDTHNAIVTPHCLSAPPNDGKVPSIEQIVGSGNYNSACFAARNNEKTKQFINWWFKQSKAYPSINPEAGHFAEQGWLRFIADYLDDVKILRHPGYNAAYWNNHERKITKVNNTWFAGDTPLHIYHFSGLDFNKPEEMSRHQNRFKATGQLLELYQDYVKKVDLERSDI